MNLYIQVKNGQPLNHPALEENLLQAFGAVPFNWEPFDRIERPVPDVYEVVSNQPVYQKIDGRWKDVWNVRPMTAEEKTAKQQEVITDFNSREQAENWAAWVFDETTCTMQPPIPRPELDETKINQGIMTFWCGVEGKWKDTPLRPKGLYKFDFFAWTWVEINK